MEDIKAAVCKDDSFPLRLETVNFLLRFFQAFYFGTIVFHFCLLLTTEAQSSQRERAFSLGGRYRPVKRVSACGPKGMF
jgi:hypothetical protein